MDIIIVAVAVIAGGASVWAFMQWGLVRPLERNVRALAASQDDVVSLWADYREATGEELVRLGERIRWQAGRLEGARAQQELHALHVAFLERKRAEACAASALALTFYGRELERADAAELELQRERIVADGLEALLSGERAA